MEITQEFLKSILHYDQDTGEMIWIKPNKYHCELLGKIAGCPARANKDKIYWNIQILGKKYKRSRIAWMWMTGSFPKDCIDHKDGNSLNDKWENLREASVLENSWNHKTRKRKYDFPMGVRQSVSGKYVARISHLKRQFTIGTFDTVKEARDAYMKEREKRFGQFA